MDFFASQDRARTKTTLLVFAFLVAVVLIILAIYLVLALVLLGAEAAEGRRGLWDGELFLAVALGTLGVVLAGSAYKTRSLAAGGRSVAEMLDGRLVDPNSTDPDERRLLNVVEEMAIASGMPVPPVYLLSQERGMNAFAAGFTPGDAVIGVTRGSIEHLNRDELQGVIAHEFSHILRGDMRLNLRLMGVLYGILVISMIGWTIFRATSGSSRRLYGRRKGTNPLPLVGLALFVIGYVGVVVGKLIKSAVSRQREFLADASAVQFTRNPAGIAGALMKIGGFAAGSRVGHAEAEEASHLFFGNALKWSFLGWMATHPPLSERIRRLDPSFDGSFPKVTPELVQRERWREESRSAPAGLAGVPGALAFGPADVATRVGNPGPAELAYAETLLADLPADLRQLVREPHGARTVVYALLLDRDGAVRREQFAALAESAAAADLRAVERVLPAVQKLGPAAHLPLVELALPALGYLSPGQFQGFAETVRRLATADRRLSLFEYALERMLARHLAGGVRGRKPLAVKHPSLSAVRGAAAGLLSVLAQAGRKDAAGAQQAFALGAEAYGGPRHGLALVPREAAGLELLDRALATLETASHAMKKQVLAASAACIGTDGKITLAEGELLRVIAEALDCPLPPLAAQAPVRSSA